MNKLNITVENIYAVGDIHGIFSSLISMIKRYEITNSCIIVCGDCGLGFNKWSATKIQLTKLNNVCKKQNVTIVMFRGNHDDPAFFTQGKITSNIIPVPDYTVINDHILCVGGGTSIDRQYRIQLKDKLCREYFKYHPSCSIEEAINNTTNYYWPDELPVYDENAMNEIKEAGIQITTVCTHTCPSFCDPVTKDGIQEWIKADPDLDECVTKERNVMDSIHQKLMDDGHPLKEWIYGHYHRHSMQDIFGVKYMMLGAVVYDGGNVDWCEIRN
jgi:UDP-2,3-diacylglucosamine pyrophosphatase LpxH